MPATPQDSKRPMHAREKLDYQQDGRIPRFWNGGDPYKTRFFDAMSLTFPIGERYFISGVRAYRDQITDPALLNEVKDFTRQEAQHGIVHARFNQMQEEQGLNMAGPQRFLDRKLKWLLSRWPAAFNLSYTAAAEHLTAMMCTTFMERPDLIEGFDHRIRAMYTWHSIEEVEHKAVCFDVLTQVAKGAWCLYRPGGVFMPALGYYLSYFKPGFHPWQHQGLGHYQTWLDAFNRTGDAVEAGDVCAREVLSAQ